MSPLVLRLRQRIDVLTDERDRARRRNHGIRKRCVYCGAVTRTVKLTPACRAHADLLVLDPHYALEAA